MLRRTFFKSLSSNLALLLLPRWGRAQTPAHNTPPSNATMNDIAAVVLPESLGDRRIAATAAAFERWLSGYHAGADAGYGYGFPKPTVLGPNPGAHYAEQLKQLDSAAGKSGSFASLSKQEKRAAIQSALAAAGVTAIPPRPNGKHVAADLMSYFYSSSDGVDFCYNAAIRESDCRGLAGSDKRPAPVS